MQLDSLTNKKYRYNHILNNDVKAKGYDLPKNEVPKKLIEKPIPKIKEEKKMQDKKGLTWYSILIGVVLIILRLVALIWIDPETVSQIYDALILALEAGFGITIFTAFWGVRRRIKTNEY
jgi:hypothetical protein